MIGSGRKGESSMTYAGNRRIIDADSHLIELDDFLDAVASPSERELIPRMDAQTELPVVPEALARGRELFARRQNEPELMARFEASLLDTRKSGWNRLGAFDPQERSHCLGLFGFEMQLVLPTFSFHQVAHCTDPSVLNTSSKSCRYLSPSPLSEIDSNVDPISDCPNIQSYISVVSYTLPQMP